MQTSACQIRKLAYRHNRITSTPSAATTEIVRVNQPPPFHSFAGRPPGVLIHPRRLAVTYGVPSGTAKYISRRRPCRPWPARHMRTPGRAGSRSGGVSVRVTSSSAQLAPPIGDRPVCSTTAPVYPRYRGAACSLPGRPFSIPLGRAARVLVFFIAPPLLLLPQPRRLPLLSPLPHCAPWR